MKYPYYINPDIDKLAHADGEERLRLMRHIAANVGDEATLRTILGIDPEEFSRFYPDMEPRELSTEDTITTFISKFSSEKASRATEIEEIVAVPAPDYTVMLEDEEEETPSDVQEKDASAQAISAFLAAVPPKRTLRKKTEQNHDDTISPADVKTDKKDSKTPASADPSLSEALLKVMVKNKNYEKALEIINELSLNNPKKSVYFAYQMRFIRKLMKNEAATKSLKP